MARGMSLHIGLNALDPVHYQGWDGRLGACENDANQMSSFARSFGFEPQILLTRQANRQNVIDAFGAIAHVMRAGDIFLVTMSSHGAQIPDNDRDELEDIWDETLCLFDGMLLDDELVKLWTLFPAETRIVLMSDSCHSGGMVRRRGRGLIDCNVDEVADDGWRAIRSMSPNRARQTYLANEQFYRDIQNQVKVELGSGSTAVRAAAIKASVRIFGACQENQLAYENGFNGDFTAAVLGLLTWPGFSGNYEAFYRAIVRGMPENQTPLHRMIGQPNPAFNAQRPLNI